MSNKRRAWTSRRNSRRRAPLHQPHPIYAERGNEQPLLEQLIARDPPDGGLTDYIRDLSRNTDDKEKS